MTTYCIEGEWSGYTSSQRRVVHREYTTSNKRAEWCRKNYGIRYTDGTMLILSVQEKGRGRRQPEFDGYGKLISDCIRHDCSSVGELPDG